jgi:hypothetical protein
LACNARAADQSTICGALDVFAQGGNVASDRDVANSPA